MSLARSNHKLPRRAFTLVELLVVIAIIGLLAVATIPLVMPSLNQQQINFGARFLHGELAQARDRAIRDNAPRGIRLLPDPPSQIGPNGLREPLGPYTSSRIVTIEQAPDYGEGMLYDLSGVPFYALAGVPPAYPPTYYLTGTDDLRYSVPPLNAVPYSYGVMIAPPTLLSEPVSRRTWLILAEVKFTGAVPVPADPTAWFWNIRQGERVQLGNTGRSYPIAGPMSVGNSLAAPNNPDRQINAGLPSVFQSLPGNAVVEFLIVTNGRDDNNNGFTDEQFDGIDNDGDGVIDPGFNGIDDNGNGVVDEPLELFYSAKYPFPSLGEYESEQTLTSYTSFRLFPPPPPNPLPTPPAQVYSITRRAVPAPDSREVALPRGVKIDLTGWNAALRPYPANSGSPTFPFLPERSRLPVDPYTGYVDILLNPSGEIVPLGANASPGTSVTLPFYHFWLAEDKDITGAFDDTTIQNNGIGFQLPMPRGTSNDQATASYPPGLPALEGNQRIVSINARTGQVVTNTPVFSLNDLNRPYEAAQTGVKEEP